MADSGQVEVFVQVGGEDVAAGDLWMHRAGRSQSASFAYRPSYIGRDGAYELEPDLPLQTGQFQTPVGRSLFGAFSDTAPDRWGRKLIERAEAASAREERRTARAFSEADYLLGVRDDLRQGALRYRRADGEAFLATEDSKPRRSRSSRPAEEWLARRTRSAAGSTARGALDHVLERIEATRAVKRVTLRQSAPLRAARLPLSARDWPCW